MGQIQIPSIFEATSAPQFFREFIELNRYRRGFSQRLIATKIGWPVSYIPDLVHGRKKLTVARALQFAKHFRLNPIDQEKLIWLSLLSLGLIEQRELSKFQSSKSRARKEPTKEIELLDAKVLLVFECIRWLNGSATPDAIRELTAKKSLSEVEIKQSIGLLLAKGKIQSVGIRFKALEESIFTDDWDKIEDGLIHRQFAQFLDVFFQKKIGPAVYNSGFVHIDRSRFEDIADRIVALRNWFIEISKEDQKRLADRDVRLFQFDFHLTPVFSKETANKLRSKK